MLEMLQHGKDQEIYEYDTTESTVLKRILEFIYLIFKSRYFDHGIINYV